MGDIKTGLWLDNSHPRLGWTITLPIDDGSVLLSALTLLVTIAGASLWSLIAFSAHSFVASREKVDIVDIQHQVVLRNSAGALSTAFDFVRIHHAWSTAGVRNLWKRTLVLAAIGVVTAAGVSTASILTSRVANRGYSTVLARSLQNNCGFIQYPTSMSVSQKTAFATKGIVEASRARNYAIEFYTNTTGARVDRSIFPVARLPMKTDSGADCPATNQSLCMSGYDGFLLETELLDSHRHLGINARKSDRVTVQIRTTCAVLNIGDRISVDETAGTLDVNLGPNLGFERTYRYFTHTFQDRVGYQIWAASSLAGGNTTSDGWLPAEDVNRSDADVTIIFLSQNTVEYSEPVHDPFFSANRPTNSTTPGAPVFFFSDYLVKTMLCADQVALCNPMESICTPLGGLIALNNAVSTGVLGFNDVQYSTASRIINSLSQIGTWVSPIILGTGSLFAHDHILSELVSTGLPDTQWQLEALGWFQTSLAKFQASIIEYAYKRELSPEISVASPHDTTATPDPLPGRIASLKDQCDNQLIRSAAEVQNFSFAGVMTIVCVSFALILLGLLLPVVVTIVARRKVLPSMRSQARQADEKLHLLRLAMAGVGRPSAAEWDLGAWDVPVVRRDADVSRPVVQRGLTAYTAHISGTTQYHDAKLAVER